MEQLTHNLLATLTFITLTWSLGIIDFIANVTQTQVTSDSMYSETDSGGNDYELLGTINNKLELVCQLQDYAQCLNVSLIELKVIVEHDKVTNVMLADETNANVTYEDMIRGLKHGDCSFYIYSGRAGYTCEGTYIETTAEDIIQEQKSDVQKRSSEGGALVNTPNQLDKRSCKPERVSTYVANGFALAYCDGLWHAWYGSPGHCESPQLSTDYRSMGFENVYVNCRSYITGWITVRKGINGQ